MKLFAALAATLVLAPAATAQILTEDFSSGTPPTGWTIIDNAGGGAAGWVPGFLDFNGHDHTGWALHDYDTVNSADTWLVSPMMNFSASGGTNLTFLTETEWADYMAHAVFSLGDGVSTVEASSDGGATWTTLWTDDVVLDFNPVTRAVDLSAYDGMPAVQIAFRYFGTDAHTWWIDDVVVYHGPAPVYSITGLAGGGTATLTITGVTPGGSVLIGYSLAGAGPTMTPFGLVDISAPISQLPTLLGNPSGLASLSTGVPTRASGFTLYTQAADVITATLSNSLADPIL